MLEVAGMSDPLDTVAGLDEAEEEVLPCCMKRLRSNNLSLCCFLSRLCCCCRLKAWTTGSR